MQYTANPTRYDSIKYNRCGNSGLLFPPISLGLWHNFGSVDNFDHARTMICKAFDLGITHIDLANNYGPDYGSAEENFGKILANDLKPYRDELILSTKAGYDMWPGPYGNWGSRKYLLTSLDQSLKRMQVDYVDIFYHHRPDPETPLEETLLALDQAVKQGKALYVGLSRYSPEDTRKAYKIFKELKTPFIIHQEKYSLFDREPEKELFAALEELNLGCIVFSPLAQGLLSDKYINGIPGNSRASQFAMTKQLVTEENMNKVKKLNKIAQNREQSLSQMALAWTLRQKCVVSAIIGASSVKQIEENVNSLKNLTLSSDENKVIEEVMKG